MTAAAGLRWTRWRVDDVSFLPPFDLHTCTVHQDGSAVDVTGSGYFIRFRDDIDNDYRCVVIRRGPRGGLCRTNGSVTDVLPFVVLAWRGADRTPDPLLNWLSDVLDPVTALRFAATVG
jgi:hypothetical protein